MEVVYKHMLFNNLDELILYANTHSHEYELVSHTYEFNFIQVSAIFKKQSHKNFNYDREFAKYPTCEQIAYGSVNYS